VVSSDTGLTYALPIALGILFEVFGILLMAITEGRTCIQFLTPNEELFATRGARAPLARTNTYSLFERVVVVILKLTHNGCLSFGLGLSPNLTLVSVIVVRLISDAEKPTS
jgi:hypothetical protein